MKRDRALTLTLTDSDHRNLQRLADQLGIKTKAGVLRYLFRKAVSEILEAAR